MKTSALLLASTLLIAAVACNNDKNKVAGESDSGSVAVTEAPPTKVVAGNYTNLETGQQVYVIPDPETGYAIDSVSMEPVLFYIDLEGDTLTNTGEPAIGLIKTEEGKWKLSDDAKIKVDDDGSMKIKDGDSKIKIDENGNTKVKDGADYKKKTEGDSESKEKDGTTKVKVEDGKTKVKPQNR